MLMVASQVRLAVRAIRLKMALLTAYDTFWPAAARGVKLLARGRFADFGRKLLNEMPEARESISSVSVRSGPPLFLAGHILGLGGYDHLVLNILKGLMAAGVNVCRDRRSCFRKQLVPRDLRPSELVRRGHQPRLAIAPPHLLRRYRPDARTVAYTMWETDTLPPDGVKHLNRCGLVIVPSKWGMECFRAGGVAVPIEVVPLGHDPGVYSPASEPQQQPGVCTFGTAGALDEGGLRKNVQLAIEQFRAAFPDEADVRLRVKITPRSPRVRTHGDPRIEVVDTGLSSQQLTDWYRSLDAYVNASAGEGFGLHLLEAMACGVPLISTRFGGVGSFFDSRFGYEVGHELVEVRNAIYRGLWSAPDAAGLASRMREVYRDRRRAAERGRLASLRAGQFRWEDTIRKLVIVLIQHGYISSARE